MADRWARRPIPDDLAARYETEGWWTDATLGSRVAEWLAAAPSTPVHIHSRTRPWHGDFAAIDAEARRLVTLLRTEGIEPGEAVAFQMPNWREALVAFAGLAMGGYVLVPIVAIYGPKEVGFILAESGAAAYLSPVAHGHVDHLAIADHHAPDTLRLHLVIDGDDTGQASTRRLPWSALDSLEPATDLPTAAATDPVVIAYTSGTTSDPKGVIHDHCGLLAELRHMHGWVNPDLPNLMGSPVAHATGMLGAALSPLQTASPIHLIDRWDPGHALEVMLDHGIGGGTGASVFLTSLLDHPDCTPAHLASMRQVGLGGAPVPVALGERAEALGIKIIRAYGSTEHPSVTGSMFDDAPHYRHATDGRAMPSVEIRLVDDDGADVGPGTPGEIWSRGPELCVGYTDPELNTAFDDDGWYHTGDIGVLDADGWLTITDRVSDIIIRGGENISAAEVEGAIAAMADVAEVAVVAAPDDRLGEHACAVVRLAPDVDDLELAAITSHLDGVGLARQKWPEEVRVVADFPRTASGKIRKVDIRADLRPTGADQ